MEPLIYCLDDEQSIREVYAQALGYGNYRHKEFATPSEFFNAIKREMPDLIILDLMLPEQDGLEILRQLRTDPAIPTLPIIIVSAKGEENDRVKGLELGADDYLCKPFGVLELLARVKARLRDKPETPDDGLYLSENERRFYIDGNPIEMTLKEFEVLRFLYRNRGKVVEKETLLRTVWDMPEGIETRTLDVHIASIRKKVGHAVNIKTLRGVGYILQ